MRVQSSLSQLQREPLVELFEQGLGYKAAAHRLGVSPYPVRRLERRFKLHGRLCLVEKPTRQQYSFEVKKEIVDRFNAGQSMMELASVFGLSSDQLVKDWVRAWRAGGDEALRPKLKGRPKGSSPAKLLTEKRLVAPRNRETASGKRVFKKMRDLSNQRRS
ncbi:IS3 family transposase [Corynebacterium diphtheriae]|nr:IS3 family transposase [Corynebacterium diphtheriae]CAB0994446.1 IS3 family transposase [Corynebacterium diphtheriae]